MVRKLTAIDLFSGTGGFSLAAHNVGVDVLAAIELDPNAADSYHKNIVEKYGANTQVFSEDINQVDIDSIMKFQGLVKGELDLLLGGPPCQGFSSHRINDAGKNDPRNALLLRYFDFVERLKPKAFLVENVPGLLWPRHASFLNKFLKLANEHDYQVVSGKPLILNARDYGVPQNRKRAFIFALRKDVLVDDIVWPPPPTHFKAGESKWLTASSVFERPDSYILEKLQNRLVEKFDFSYESARDCVRTLEWGEPIDSLDRCNIHMHHSEELIKVFKNTPLLGDRSESGRELDCHKDYSGHQDVYGRIYPHLPSNTMTTGCNNPSKGRFVHPWLNHGISIRHAARLQQFPDDFVFSGGVMSMSKQIGNAVPINLGKVLISSIVDILSKKEYQG